MKKKTKKLGANLLKALNSFTETTTNFRELFGSKNKNSNSGNNSKFRHTKSKQRVATVPSSGLVNGSGFEL